MFELNGKVAMVTGAGSPKGIGQAIARALAGQGASVALCDIDDQGVYRLAGALKEEGLRAEAFQLDVTNEAQVEQIVQTIVDRFGGLHILVNNAGITQPVRIQDTTLEWWNRVYAVNATGTFLCSRAVLQHMIQGQFGRIISMSSVSGKRGGGVYGGAHYSAAKAAILGFSKALAREVAEFGVTVNSVTPGLILTDIRGGVEPPEKQREMSKDIPLRRVGTPEEVAATVCFLASDEAGYITGEEIDVNGGSHMD